MNFFLRSMTNIQQCPCHFSVREKRQKAPVFRDLSRISGF